MINFEQRREVIAYLNAAKFLLSQFLEASIPHLDPGHVDGSPTKMHEARKLLLADPSEFIKYVLTEWYFFG